MKVGDSIWDINIDKFRKPDKSFIDGGGKDGVKIIEHKVIGVNDFNIVIDDISFKTISRKLINVIYTDVRVGNHFMCDGVFVSIVSSNPPDKPLLERMVANAQAEVRRNYDWLCDFTDGLNNLIKEY